MSAAKHELPHGLGLGAILPAIIRAIYPVSADVLADIYAPLAPDLKGVPGEADYAAKKVEEWLFTVGCTQKLSDFGFNEADIPVLVDLAMTTPSLGLLLSLSPVEATKELIGRIYQESLYPMS